LPGGGTAPFERPALTVPIDPRGTDTFPAQFKLDLRADKQFELNRGWGTLGLVFDIFNVFNDDAVVSYRSTRVEFPETFFEPSRIIQPRIWRLGLRWQF
jgi:hypothetical protein